LITVQIDLLLGCSTRFAVAAIGYVAALLLVKIEKASVRLEMSSNVKVEDRDFGDCFSPDRFPSASYWRGAWIRTEYVLVAIKKKKKEIRSALVSCILISSSVTNNEKKEKLFASPRKSTTWSRSCIGWPRDFV
jgi:hypothetical protein